MSTNRTYKFIEGEFLSDTVRVQSSAATASELKAAFAAGFAATTAAALTANPGAAAGPDVVPAADALGLYTGLSDELAAQVSEI